MKVTSRFAVLLAGVAAVASGATVAWAGSDDGPTITAGDRVAAQRAAPTYQPDNELKFIPVTPCQVVNTGKTGHKLGTASTTTFVVAGTTGFETQGGQSGGCGVPASATAATFTLITTGAPNRGTLKVSSADTTPSQISLAYQSGEPTTGEVTSKLGSAGVKVSNTGGPVNLAVVVTGYYAKPLAGFISPSGNPYSGSSRILNATHVGTGTYEVQFDRNIRYCSATAAVYVSNYFASTTTWYDSTRPDTVRVYLWNKDGTLVDQYFYIQVEC